jgi:hypothetical protein
MTGDIMKELNPQRFREIKAAAEGYEIDRLTCQINPEMLG